MSAACAYQRAPLREMASASGSRCGLPKLAAPPSLGHAALPAHRVSAQAHARRALARFELVGQVIATRRSRYAPASEAIEWAFAAYRPQADLTLRLGRVNPDWFLMSDYRNVGFAYLMARPPVEFYGSLPSSLDGMDLARVWNGTDSQWRAKAFWGRAHTGDLSADSRVAITPVFGATLAYEPTADDRYYIGYTLDPVRDRNRKMLYV